tara:strand:+ start:2225 stop:2665 length:441 start_codon:yes stop_codon:yes gene_type:complete
MELVIIGVLGLIGALMYMKLNTSLRRIGTQLQLANIDQCSHEWTTVSTDKIETEEEIKVLTIQKCTVCGKLDKNAESIEKVCRHTWVVLKDIKTPSPFSDMDWEAREGMGQSRMTEKWLHKTQRTIVAACTKCGEIDKTHTSNMDD